jgi:hypothetical protein
MDRVVNFRHAFALALVGWYLLTPPIIDEDGTSKVDPSVSLSQWYRGERVFNSGAECEEQRIKLREIAEHHKDWIGPSGSVSAADHRYLLLTNLLCVSADDPRLKGK